MRRRRPRATILTAGFLLFAVFAVVLGVSAFMAENANCKTASLLNGYADTSLPEARTIGHLCNISACPGGRCFFGGQPIGCIRVHGGECRKQAGCRVANRRA